MALIDLVKDAGQVLFVCGESQTVTVDAAPDLAADVDPVPIGDPDEDEGCDDDEDDDEDEDEDEDDK
jgi:hypothetical protein